MSTNNIYSHIICLQYLTNSTDFDARFSTNNENRPEGKNILSEDLNKSNISPGRTLLCIHTSVCWSKPNLNINNIVILIGSQNTKGLYKHNYGITVWFPCNPTAKTMDYFHANTFFFDAWNKNGLYITYKNGLYNLQRYKYDCLCHYPIPIYFNPIRFDLYAPLFCHYGKLL